MSKWESFQPCAQCGYDFATDEGHKGCEWGQCPYIPEELNVYCDTCRFNYYTLEGNPRCEDPLTCEHSAEPLAHVENYKRWLAARQTPAPQVT